MTKRKTRRTKAHTTSRRKVLTEFDRRRESGYQLVFDLWRDTMREHGLPAVREPVGEPQDAA